MKANRGPWILLTPKQITRPVSLCVYMCSIFSLKKLVNLFYKFLANNYKHDVLFYSTLIAKLMESAHRVIQINMHIEEITYNVTLRNPQAIKMLQGLDPVIVGKAFEALVSAERTQVNI